MCRHRNIKPKLCLSVGKPWRYASKKKMCLFKGPLEPFWNSCMQKGSGLFTQTALYNRHRQRGTPEERFTSKDTDFKSSFSIQSKMLISTPPTLLPPLPGLFLTGCGGTAHRYPTGTTARRQGQSHARPEPAPAAHHPTELLTMLTWNFQQLYEAY